MKMRKSKRKGLWFGLICLGIVCCGCAKNASEPAPEKEEPVISVQNAEQVQERAELPEIEPQESDTEEVTSKDEAEAETTSKTETDTTSQAENNLTFEDLSKKQFWFSSGAGGWGEEFVIEEDGFFTGVYHDSDMGSTGEGYPNGTMYTSSYSGYFTNLTKVDEYTYKMTRSDITYKDEIGKEEILDEVLYVYTESYGLGGNDTFYIYLPGTPVSHISEDLWIWLRDGNESETELTMTAIVDEENQLGICSYERITPAEDARMTYETYKESYDAYVKKASELTTTLDLKMNASAMYEVSDECLNYLWDIIRYQTEGGVYEQILEEQRQWIAEKEEAANVAMEEWEGGSFAPVIYLDTQAEMTMQRCEVLLQYIENNCKTPDK